MEREVGNYISMKIPIVAELHALAVDKFLSIIDA